MHTIVKNFSRNYGVSTTECGSVVEIHDSKPRCQNRMNENQFKIISNKRIILDKNIIDWNMCFYACLATFILNNFRKFQDLFLKTEWSLDLERFKQFDIATKKAILMLFLKKRLTKNLPHADIFIGQYNPEMIGSAVDERVIIAAVQELRSNIIILKEGAQLYVNRNVSPKATICLFLNKGHYKIVLDQDAINMERLGALIEDHETFNDLYDEIIKEKSDVKRCLQKKKRNKEKFNWTKNK